ncbi:MAG: 50S ribosomal protein L6 [Candidatus Saccharibacteria bacterium]|jgi:large subunit ribosomal protein L6
MSRIGRNPIALPESATLVVAHGVATVTGPKGELTVEVPENFAIKQADGQVTLEKKAEDRVTNARYGLVRTLLANAIIGVTTGFEKKLEMNGVGFRVEKKGDGLSFALGFSHKIDFAAPAGIQLGVEGNVITVSGANKQEVGQTAARIRELKKPEPYKGKGIKYIDERIRRKAGKAAAKGA